MSSSVTSSFFSSFFFFNDTATTEIYTLSLHDALPILNAVPGFSKLCAANLSKLTGENFETATDLVEATPDTGAYVSYSSALKRLAIKLSKICNDLRLMASGPRCGLNEINRSEEHTSELQSRFDLVCRLLLEKKKKRKKKRKRESHFHLVQNE